MLVPLSFSLVIYPAPAQRVCTCDHAEHAVAKLLSSSGQEPTTLSMVAFGHMFKDHLHIRIAIPQML